MNLKSTFATILQILGWIIIIILAEGISAAFVEPFWVATASIFFILVVGIFFILLGCYIKKRNPKAKDVFFKSTIDSKEIDVTFQEEEIKL